MKMKTTIHFRRTGVTSMLLAAMLAVAVGGCGKKADSARKASPQTNAPASIASEATSAAERTLTGWQQGNKAEAVQRFIDTDWKGGPAFSPESPLSRRESDLPEMSAGARDKLLKDVMVQLQDLKRLATAVRDQGQAIASTDPELARRYFAKLDEFGAALDQPGGMKIVQLTGQACRKMAAAESTKLAK
jgi:hypothetical protein